MKNDVKRVGVRGRGRQGILEAALALVAEGGRQALTLEAVAARAGVSRSGLRYHFAAKEHLLTAVAQAIVARFARACQLESETLPDAPNRSLKSYVLASTSNRAGNDQLIANALAAGPVHDKSMDPIRRYWQERFPPFSEAVGFDRAAVIHVATEGLWFMDVLNLSPFNVAERDAVVRAILALVDGGPSPGRHRG